MTTLAAARPDLAAQWHRERNGVATPDDVKPMSRAKAWWRCPRGHEWEAVVAGLTRAKHACPYCAGRRPSPERNLAVLFPAVAAEWHPTRNGDRNPADVAARARDEVWWQCSAGHEWPAVIRSRTSTKRGCPYCAGTRVTPQRNLEALFPAIAAEWHPTRNGDDGPREAFPYSPKKAWWHCPRCAHDWPAVIRSRTRSGTGCPACAARTYKGIPLADNAPEVLAEWCAEFNGGPGDQVTAASNRRVWWRCQQDRTHLWRTAVQNRTREKSGCPYCAGRRPWSGRNLAVLLPDLAAQWHPTRNNALSPTDVLAHSSRRCWWQCHHGHEWDARIVSRAVGRGCPTCARAARTPVPAGVLGTTGTTKENHNIGAANSTSFVMAPSKEP